MGLFGLKKKKGWEPLKCNTSTIIELMKQCEDSGMLEIIFSYNEKIFNVGISSDYDNGRFFDTTYYIDDQQYLTLTEFCEKSTINGQLFINIDYIYILEADEGNPRNLTLLDEFEKRKTL